MTNQWEPLKDLPDKWSELQHTEFKSLAEIWKEQSNKLQKRDALRQFNDRLRREWAIETGIIENLYSIDRGITQLLIEKGLEESLIPHGATEFDNLIYFPETMHASVQHHCRPYAQAWATFTDKWGQRQSMLSICDKRNMIRTMPTVDRKSVV